MGERLVVEIRRNDRPLATVYYHWSAYTRPAVNITNSMYKYVLADSDRMADNELILALIRFAENTVSYGYIGDSEEGNAIRAQIEQMIMETDESAKDMLMDMLLTHGGLCLSDRARASEMFPDEEFSEKINRNEGLVAICEETMLEDHRWAEGTVIIDLDKKKVLNGMAYECTIEEYLDECVENDDDCFTDPDDLVKIPIDIYDFALDEIGVVKDILDINEDESWLRFEDKIFQIRNG